MVKLFFNYRIFFILGQPFPGSDSCMNISFAKFNEKEGGGERFGGGGGGRGGGRSGGYGGPREDRGGGGIYFCLFNSYL